MVLGRYAPLSVTGFFLARFFYELDPLSFNFLGSWPGPIGLAALSVLLFFSLILVSRRLALLSSFHLSSTPLYWLLIYIFWPHVDLRFALVLLLGSIVLVAQDVILRTHRSSTLAVGAIVFSLYLLTLGDHVGRADTFEFQVVAPQLGIAHPTGYPLFILLSKLFSLLPINSMAWRINLASAVFATTAVVLTYRLIVALLQPAQHPERSDGIEDSIAQSTPGGPPTLLWRVGHGQDAADSKYVRLIVAIAAITLAASHVFWSQAIIAEVYALDALLVIVILSILVMLIQSQSSQPDWSLGFSRFIRWMRPAKASTPAAEKFSGSKNSPAKTQPSAIYVLALAFGLALTHHLTSVILIPPIILTLILVRPKLKLKQWLASGIWWLVGLLPWLFIPLRWPALHNGATMTISEWTSWIFGQRFSGALNLSLWSDPTRWGIISHIVLDQFGVVGSILALIGLLVLIKKSWRIALITFGTFAGYIFYGLVYNVPDVDVFIIPAFILMAIWIGVSLYELSLLITRYSLLVTHHAPRTTFILLAALIPISIIATNYSPVNQYGANADLEAWGRYVLSLPIPDRSVLLVDSEKIAPLYYLQVTEHIRPDLDILVLGDESLYRQELDKRIASGQAVYLARFLPNLPYHLRSLGPLVEVSTQPGYLAPNLQTSPHFGDSIDLTNIALDQSNPIRITFGWQALTDSRPNYHLRLQLADRDGRVWWEDTGAHPVGGYYPTGLWTKGETVADYHEIKLASYVPTGDYTLRVGFFVPFRDDGLITDNGVLWWTLDPIHIDAIDMPDTLAHETRSIFGSSLAVTSIDELGAVPPSSRVALRLNSIGSTPSQAARLSIVDAAGVNISMTQQVITAGQSRFEFAAPEANGRYTLRLNFQQPARCAWLTPITADCEIGSFEVAGEAIGSAINFDNQVLLMDTKIDRDTAKPNESIHIDLTWRGLKTWPDNYTAFVHLIGPDGKVHGQVDQWPVQGTLPTSSWTAGQAVNDPYSVTLAPDAPSGQYQVEVGWYLLATLRRLSVLDSSGRPSDDHVIVGEFNVP
jgi:hypothetical protein